MNNLSVRPRGGNVATLAATAKVRVELTLALAMLLVGLLLFTLSSSSTSRADTATATQELSVTVIAGPSTGWDHRSPGCERGCAISTSKDVAVVTEHGSHISAPVTTDGRHYFVHLYSHSGTLTVSS